MTADHAQARARAEYQKKGWSEAKISRALQSKRESESRREDKYAIFRRSMAALVDAIGPVRLFVHMYGGELKTENVGIAKQLTVYLQDFESSAESFPSDTILTLMRQGARKRS